MLSTPTILPRTPLRSQVGAFDLPSIVVGVAVVGILTVGVLVAVFGVIPWAQDEAAKQDLVSVPTAEGVAKTKGEDGFLDSADLAAATYLPLSDGVKVAADDKGTCYTGIAKSGSGKLFYSTNKTNQPLELTPTTMTHPVPGCLPSSEASDLIKDTGGYDDSYFDEVGDGAGTNEDPGIGETEPASDNGRSTDEEPDDSSDGDSNTDGGAVPSVPSMPAEDPNTEVRVVDLRVSDGSVTVDFENTGSTDYRIPYSIHVACRDDYDGAVTIERIHGYFDLNSHIISGLSLVACMPGTTIVDVWIPTYDWDGQVYRWRINYIYEYAEPVVRGATASATGLWCIENHDNANTIGNPVDLAECANVDAQRWQWNGDGEVRQSTLAGKCLAVSSGKLVLDECDGSAAQHFTAEDFQGKDYEIGLVQMVNKANGQCIDIPGGTLHHIQLVTNECDGTLPQSWYMPGMGKDAAEIVEPQPGHPAVEIEQLGTVSTARVVDSGSDLTFQVSIGYGNGGKKTVTHYELTCLSESMEVRRVSALTVAEAPGYGNETFTKRVSCGDDQIIAYAVEPVTATILRELDASGSFAGYTTSGTLTWDATDGFPVVGSVGSDRVVNTGSDLQFKVSIGYGLDGKPTTTHYEITCLGTDMNTSRRDGVLVNETPGYGNETYTETVSCGEGQIIGYTVKPITLDGLKEVSNPMESGGYTTSGTLTWDATDGFPVVGSVGSDRVVNTGSDLQFKVSIGYGLDGKPTTTHYEITCLGTDMHTFYKDGVLVNETPGYGNETYTETISCGEGQVIGYTVKPLTLDGLKEVSNPMDAGGYTTSGKLSWNAEAGFPTVGSVGSDRVVNTGSDLQFKVSIGYGLDGKPTTTHYEITCLGANMSTYRFDGVLVNETFGYGNETYTETVSCGEGQVIGYTVKPITLDGLKEVSNPMDAGGYTTSGTLTWDATEGFPVVGSVHNDQLVDSGSGLQFDVRIGYGLDGKPTTTHYEVTCLSSEMDFYRIDGVRVNATPGYGNETYTETVSCGEGQVIGYTVKPLTLDGLKEVSNPMDAGGYTTSGTLNWTA